MTRFVAVLLAAAVLASAARADIPPPLPPLGKKYVSLENEVVLGKDVTGYVFVQSHGHGPGAPRMMYYRVELPPGEPVQMPAAGRYTYTGLYAVPQEVAKEYKTEDELCKALEAGKVKGAHSIGFGGDTAVPITTLRKSVKWTHTITGIDDEGIKRTVEGEGHEKPADRPEKQGRPSVLGGACVAGGAGALALLLGGLWLAGRARRKM